jgi:hypothetical protein
MVHWLPPAIQYPYHENTRNPLPDVPEDVEVHLAHLNDPNYTFDSSQWSDEDVFELNDKKGSINETLPSGKHYESDLETQSDYSRSSSHFATSRGPLQSGMLV